MKSMTIGKAARSASVGVETIRFYERKGLIEQPPKPLDSGYRLYPEETVRRVRFIRGAQELGFTLREIDELLSLRADPAADSSDVRDQAMAKRGQVDEKIKKLRRIRAALEELIAACPGGGALRTCSIIEAIERTGEDDDAGAATAPRVGRTRV